MQMCHWDLAGGVVARAASRRGSPDCLQYVLLLSLYIYINIFIHTNINICMFIFSNLFSFLKPSIRGAAALYGLVPPISAWVDAKSCSAGTSLYAALASSSSSSSS